VLARASGYAQFFWQRCGMKIDRHGRAKILTPIEIQLLFNKGLVISRDRALFGIGSVTNRDVFVTFVVFYLFKGQLLKK
jgi:hypothetical protein